MLGISKDLRRKVLGRYGGRCGYCGKEHVKLQVDHIFPLALKHLWTEAPKDINCEDNLMPACARCNRYKTSMRLGCFRYQVSQQLERARKNWNFRIARDYGLIKETPREIVFYFEKIKNKKVF